MYTGNYFCAIPYASLREQYFRFYREYKGRFVCFTASIFDMRATGERFVFSNIVFLFLLKTVVIAVKMRYDIYGKTNVFIVSAQHYLMCDRKKRRRTGGKLEAVI